MGRIFKFLQALTRMASKGDIKIDDAYKFAKQEFGEVNDLLKLQINKIFKESKAPSIKQPKKEGEVIEASFKPGMDKRGKIIDESPSQASGIMKTDEASPLMKNIEDVKQNIKGMSENSPKTFRMTEEQRNALGYPNRMIEGIVRTAAREILSKKGIDVSKSDPIDTFADLFGVNSLERLEDVSDELLTAQDYKQLNSILQKNELYDVTPKSGLNLKQSDEIEELTEFDPTDRKPNAMGGRIDYQIGGTAYDATNPIYGSSAITVTPDTTLGPQGNQIQAQTGVNPTLQGSQNPFKNLGFLNTKRHFDNNQLLKNAVTRGELSPADYNRLGGFDVAQTMGAGNPVLGGIGNLIGSTAYNAVQSIRDGQPILEGLKDIGRNVQGGTGLISDDLKAQYERIINPTVDQDRISEIVEQQKAAGVPDEGLITNFNKPTMADVAGASSGPTGYTNLRKFYNPFEGSTPMTKEEYENKSGYAPPFSPYVGYSPSEFYPSYYLDAVGPKTQEGYDSMLADLRNFTLDFGDNPYESDLDSSQFYQYALDDEGNPVGKFTNEEARKEYDEKKAFRQSRYNLGKSQLDNYFNKQTLASGGRVKLAIGSLPKGIQTLVKQINKKFGKGAMKTADEIDQPPKTDQQIISEFETRNPNPSRELTDDEIADLAEEVGELDAYDFDGTVGSANRIRNEVKAYEADMLKQYEAAGGSKRAGGPKDPVAEAIDNVSPGFANDLKYDAQLVADDLAEKRFGKEFYDLDQNQQILKKKREPIPESIKEGVDDVMRDTSPAGLEKSLEVDDLMLKYPGINRDLAKQIANDPDPKRKADVISMIEQTFKMDEMGMSGDEIIDTFRKKTDRTKQANGGLSYLMGL
jgi:hypothetical protein